MLRASPVDGAPVRPGLLTPCATAAVHPPVHEVGRRLEELRPLAPGSLKEASKGRSGPLLPDTSGS